jgi:hypothetical protein
MPRSIFTLCCLSLGAALLAADESSAHASASHFVDTTLSREQDARDSLAAGFDTRQLPFIMAALVSDPPRGVDPDRLYRALSRWHFYAGRKFDPDHTGLWTTGLPTADSGSGTSPSPTLASGAATELVELSSLARLASRQEHVFDPMVWWHDHLELRKRLAKTLYDPLDAGYADLDSLGRRLTRTQLSGLIPIALGARHGGEATRLAAWRLWTGEPIRNMQGDLGTELQARQTADAFEPWSNDRGLQLVSREAMAALSLQALDELDEPDLAVYARDALAARGITARDTIQVRLGGWSLAVHTDELALQPTERSRAALRFLAALGVFADDVADSVTGLADLPADASDESISAAISKLTDLLVELRAVDVRSASSQWELRRREANDVDPADRAVFDFQWADLHVWYDRALDLVTADILAWHLRPDYRSPWTASLDPSVVGQGDRPVLLVHSRVARAASETVPGPLTLMWTDGSQLLQPQTFPLRRVDDRNFLCDVPSLPSRTGLWHLVVEGLPQRPRIPTAVSVVDPVVVSVIPVERRDQTIAWSIQLRSQIRLVVNGRVDLDAPLNWTAAPATSQAYSLQPGGTQELEFTLTPDAEVSPGTYPLRWDVWSESRLVGAFEELADTPFSWLRVGALRVTEAERPIDSRYEFDRQIDLAQRIQGVDGQVAWTRLPAGRISPTGFVSIAGPADPEGVHYAFTAFVTQSREALLEFESAGPSRVFVNGRRVVNLERWGGRREAEVEFGPGTNFLVVKLVGTERDGASFRLRARDIDGQPLRGLGNELEHLVENYAYLARAQQAAAGAPEPQTLRLVPIRFQDPRAKSVSVVGSFNGWSPSSTRMSRTEDGSWLAKIRLRPGRFEYKFAVDGSEWVPDPNNPDAVADGFGGRNSVLVVD